MFIVTSTLQGRIILLYPINVTLGCISYFGQWNESGPTSYDLQAEVLEPACDLLCIFFSAMMTSHDSDRDNSISLGPGVRTPWSRDVDQPNSSQQWEIILCCCKRLTFGGIYCCSITYPILTITISKTLIITKLSIDRVFSSTKSYLYVIFEESLRLSRKFNGPEFRSVSNLFALDNVTELPWTCTSKKCYIAVFTWLMRWSYIWEYFKSCEVLNNCKTCKSSLLS